MHIIDTIKSLNKDAATDVDIIDTTIHFVQKELNNLYEGIAKIHLISAEQAFISASISNNSEAEIRVGIGHLRSAFNTYQVYLEDGMKKENISGGFLNWFLIEQKWSQEKITSVQLKLASVALVISLVYNSLNDIDNYLTWKNTGFQFAQRYLQDRKEAIKSWEDATWNVRYGTYDIRSKPNTHLREEYKKEVQFIRLFRETIGDI